MKRLHVSYFLGWLGLGVVLGIELARWWVVPFWVLFGAMAAGFIGFYRRQVWCIGFVLVTGLLVGWYRGSVYAQALYQTEQLAGSLVTLIGVVKEDVSTSASGRRTALLDRLVVNGNRRTGVAQIGLTEQGIHRGDTVTVKGLLAKGSGASTVTMFTAKVTSLTKGHDWAVGLRDWFVAAVRKAIREPAASLGVGYLAGQKSALPADLVTALQVAGLTHVVVASGYNLSILVRLSRRLLMKVSKFMALFGSVLLVACMMSVTGLSPSMTRAGLVTGLSLATWYYGRHFHPMILLSLAAGITALLQPSYVWHDLGWALSFLAFAGVMLVAPLLHRYFFGEKEPGTIRQILGETIAAHLTTAPIIIAAFGQLSNVAIFTNMLVLPLVPLAMLLTFIAGVGTLVFPALAWLVGKPAEWLLGYMVWVTKLFADLPWAQTTIAAPWWMIVVAYGAIVAIFLYMWRATRLQFRQTSVVV